MRNKASTQVARIGLATLVLAATTSAKDKPVDLGKCPVPVQNVVKQYLAHGTMEEIAYDEKKKTGGQPVYEAKFSLKDGRRIELHISPDGRLLQVENKNPKP